MGGEEKRERVGAGKASGKKVAKWLVKLAGIAKARRHPCLLGRSHFVPPPSHAFANGGQECEMGENFHFGEMNILEGGGSKSPTSHTYIYMSAYMIIA